MGVNFNDYYRVTDAMALAPPSSPPPLLQGGVGGVRAGNYHASRPNHWTWNRLTFFRLKRRLSLKLIKSLSWSTLWVGGRWKRGGVANVPCDTHQLDIFRRRDTPRVCVSVCVHRDTEGDTHRQGRSKVTMAATSWRGSVAE